MKNLLIAAIAITGLGLASCGKCTTCTKDGDDDERICEKDYDSKTEYGLAVDALEFGGYNCND